MNELYVIENKTKEIWSAATNSGTGGTTFGTTFGTVPVNKDCVLRCLYEKEIQILTQQCNCRCKDWSRMYVLVHPLLVTEDQCHLLQELISNTNFEGTIVLDMTNNNNNNNDNDNNNNDCDVLGPYSKGPMGIHSNFVISNSIISLDSWIHSNNVISDTHILSSSVVIGCGSITCNSNSNNNNNNHNLNNLAKLELTVGPESGGGRTLIVTPEINMIDVCQQLTKKWGQNGNIITTTTTMTTTMTTKIAQHINIKNIISSYCIVRNTCTIQGLYMTSKSFIHAATSISNVILLPQATISNTCIVENVQLQWNASIINNSNVTNTVVMEESHVGPNSIISSTIIGPDVHVSAGEIHNSVIGPSTNAHHQSLLISVLWPLGRGNVGYGANIGSNHTGRIPDQEIVSGEGIFWGLSCIVKFPIDMSFAPYSIIAAGTSLSPQQRIRMPFSLIVTSNDSNSGNNNNSNIIPGWVLSSSPYTIARSEKKYSTRRKATRHMYYTGWKIIRPEIINMCRWAKQQLENVVVAPNIANNNNNNNNNNKGKLPPLSTVYMYDKNLNGIGNNILTEKGRRAGIKAYTECIQKFALEGLLWWLSQQDKDTGGIGIDEVSLRKEFNSTMSQTCLSLDFNNTNNNNNNNNSSSVVSWPVFPWETNVSDSSSSSSSSSLWLYQKALLLEEFPPPCNSTGVYTEWICELLHLFVTLEQNYANRIYQSKKRDDQRGVQTIPDYEECHYKADTDPVIRDAKKVAEMVESTANSIIGKIKKRSKL